MNNNYRIISGNSVLNIYTLILIIGDVFLAFLLNTEIISKLIILLFFNIFNFIVLYGKFYSFYYNEYEIVVKHLWSKSSKTYLFKDLSHLEFRKIPRIGKVIVVIKKTGDKRGFGASVIEREALEKMVYEVNLIIKDLK